MAADAPMTLLDRLQNPEWVSGPTPCSDATLPTKKTLTIMDEAADEISRLRSINADMLAALQAIIKEHTRQPFSYPEMSIFKDARSAIAAAVGDRPAAAQPQVQR